MYGYQHMRTQLPNQMVSAQFKLSPNKIKSKVNGHKDSMMSNMVSEDFSNSPRFNQDGSNEKAKVFEYQGSQDSVSKPSRPNTSREELDYPQYQRRNKVYNLNKENNYDTNSPFIRRDRFAAKSDIGAIKQVSLEELGTQVQNSLKVRNSEQFFENSKHKNNLNFDQSEETSNIQMIRVNNSNETSVNHQDQYENQSNFLSTPPDSKSPMIKPDRTPSVNLSNQWNDSETMQRMKRNLQSRVQDQIYQSLIEGTTQDKKFISKSRINKSPMPVLYESTQHHESTSSNHQSSREGSLTSKTQSQVVIKEFFDNFEIEKAISIKCLVCTCFRLRNQRFHLKVISQEVLDLALFMLKEYDQKNYNENYRLNKSNLLEYSKILQSWTNIPPQLKNQRISQCYGIVQIKQNFYQVCNLLEDLNIQQSIQLEQKESLDSEVQSPINSYKIKRLSTAQNLNKPITSLSMNMSELICSFDLQNLSALENIPDFYTMCLLQYIINISDGFCHAHKNDLIHGNFDLTKVVAQKIQQGQSQGLDFNSIKSGLISDKADIKRVIDQYNFIIVSFEPWKVEEAMQKFKSQSSIYSQILQLEQFKLNRDHYLKIAKIKDLISFANSIIDIMVGRHYESAIFGVDNKVVDSNQNPTKDLKHNSKGLVDTQNSQSEFSKTALSQRFVQQIKKTLVGQDKDSKSVTGGISLDSIPLNWTKHNKIIQLLLKILQISVGPYDYNNGLDKVNTYQIFREINQMASQMYLSMGLEARQKDNIRIFNPIKKNQEQQQINDEVQRLQSSSLNNQSVLLYFALSESTPFEQQTIIHSKVRENYKQCIKLSPNNFVASLNLELFKWNFGEISDNQLLQFIKNQLSQIDKYAANLIFFLIQKRIIGIKYQGLEIEDLIMEIDKNWNQVSNITKYLYHNPEFDDQRMKLNSHRQLYDTNTKIQSTHNLSGIFRPVLRKQSTLKQYMGNKIHEKKSTHKVDLKIQNFVPQSISISNNDTYVGITGSNKILVYDTHKKQIVSSHDLPDHEELEQLMYDDQVNFKKVTTQNVRHITMGDLSKQESSFGTDKSMDQYESENNTKSELIIAIKENDSQQSDHSNKEAEGGQESGQSQSTQQNVSHRDQNPLDQIQQNQDKEQFGNQQITQTFDDSKKQRNDQMLASANFSKMSGLIAPTDANSRNVEQDNPLVSTHGYNSAMPSSHLNTKLPSNRDPASNMDLKGVGVQDSELNTPSKSKLDQLHQVLEQQQEDSRELFKVESNQTSIDLEQQKPKNQVMKTIRETTEISQSLNDTEITQKDHQKQSGPSQSIISSHRLSTSTQEQGLTDREIQDANQERIDLNKQIPQQWEISVRNNGKMIAVFDRAQQVRNKLFKHKNNEQEVLLVLTVVANQKQSQNFVLNTLKLLDGNEVLSFGFENINESFSTIYIQGKDLYLYQIDFVQNTLINKIDQFRQNILMKSIFQDSFNRGQNESKYEVVKELIQEWENNGIQVYIPKMNKDSLFLRYPNSDVISIYSIDQRRIVRKLEINQNQIKFEDSQNKLNNSMTESKQNVLNSERRMIIRDQVKDELDMREYKRQVNPFYKPGLFLDAIKYSDRVKDTQHFLIKKQENKLTKQFQKEMDIEDEQEQQEKRAETEQMKMKEVKLFEVSPKGNMIVYTKLDQIHIRVVNQRQNLESDFRISKDSMEFQFMNHFLPVYFDNDYHPPNQSQINFKQENETSVLDTFESQTYDNPNQNKQVSFIKNHFLSQRDLLKDMGAGYHVFLIDIPAGKMKNKYYSLVHPNDLDFVKKVSPNTVNNLCKELNKLNKFSGTAYQKNELIFNVTQLLQCFMKYPQYLMDCPLNPKMSSELTKQVFDFIRSAEFIDKSNLKRGQFFGLQRLTQIDSFNFERSFHFVKSFNSSTKLNSSYSAILVDRKLQLYDFISKDILFEIKAPSAGAYQLYQGQKVKVDKQPIFFFDGDNMLAIQDDSSNLIIVNIKAQIEAYSQQRVKHQSQNTTLKIDKPLGENIDIEDNFRVGEENINQKGKDLEESEPLNQQQAQKTTIEFNQTIEAIFHSRNNSGFGYLGVILENYRFMIYYVFDDSSGGCDYEAMIDCDYRLNKTMKQMGKIISIEFEQECNYFICSTDKGWIQIWEIPTKQLIQFFRVGNVDKSWHISNMLRSVSDEKQILSYDSQSHKLLLVFNRGTQKKTSSIQHKNIKHNDFDDTKQNLPIFDNCKEVDHEIIDFQKKMGKSELIPIQQIKLDKNLSHMVIVYQDFSLDMLNVENIRSPTIIYSIRQLECSTLFIDEYLTYMALLDQQRQSVEYYIFQWEYHCQKMEIPPEEETQKELSEEEKQRVAKMMKSNKFRKSLNQSKKSKTRSDSIFNKLQLQPTTDQQDDGQPLNLKDLRASLEEFEASERSNRNESKTCSIF